MGVMESINALRQSFGIQTELDSLPTGNLASVLQSAAAECPDAYAFTATGESITYKTVNQLSDDFAAYLQNHTGLKPGDRFAVQLPNLLQYPVVAFGALKAGLVLVNTNPRYTPRELKHQLTDSGAKAMVVLSSLAGELAEVIADTSLEWVIGTEALDLVSTPKRQVFSAAMKFKAGRDAAQSEQAAWQKIADATQVLALRDVLEQGRQSTYAPYEAASDELALLQYTGGTTGVSKGAELTHQSILANATQARFLFDKVASKGEGVVVTPLPLYHIYAFMVCLVLMVQARRHALLIPDPRKIPEFVKELKKQPFSVFMGLNTLFIGLLQNKEFRQLDFSNLSLTLSGGMALTENVAHEWQDATGCPVTEGYGLTETSPVVTFNIPGNEVIGSIGMAITSTEVRIIDDQGVIQDVGGEGELCVRGPQVMRGYWQKPEETAKCIDEDGWFRTGDVAKVSEDGRLWILDRLKDLIIVSGFNVYPNELENVINEHPDIVECAVIGIPDNETGEAVKLFAVKSNPALTAEVLELWCRDRLTAYKIPHQIEFLDELPKSNVGKILRAKLRPS